MVVDEEVKGALDAHLLSWKDVTSRQMFGGVAYMAQGKMFAVLMEGVLGMKLPDTFREQALTLAGVSPFRSSSGRQFGSWVQFVLLLGEDVRAVGPWLEAAYNYVGSLPAPRRHMRGASR